MGSDFSKWAQTNSSSPRSALREDAQRLGVSIYDDGNFGPNESATMRAVVSDTVLQKRVMAKRADLRASRMWILTILSAGAAVVSAVAAWTAIFVRTP